MTRVAARSDGKEEIHCMAIDFFFIFLAIFVLAMLALFVGLYVRYRGKRIVTCPETHLPVVTEINAAAAAGTWIVDAPLFTITACTRWPERAGCDQACAPQIAAAPEETLVQNVVRNWYSERSCVYCGRSIRDLGGAVAPGLRSAAGELREWREVNAEELPELLANSVAVCGACDVTEDFRRRFPDLVIDRPETPLRERLVH